MQNANNQFFDFAKSLMNPELLMNSMKKMPVMDFASFTNTAKKNAEVLTATNQMAAENLQSMIKRGSEIMQRHATDTFEVVKKTTASQDFEQAAACQQDYVKSTFETFMNNSKEMMDMTSKSMMEVFEFVGNNVSEHVKETLDKAPNKSKN